MSLALHNGSPELARRRDRRIVEMFDRCQWKELALLRHGFTPRDLMKLARTIAIAELHARNAVLGDRLDDLISRLQIVGLEAAWRFDPEREHLKYGTNGGDPFASYVADLMGKRVDDYFRSKAEGFGDRRYGNDNRYDLKDDMETDAYVDTFEDVVDRLHSATNADWYELAAHVRDMDVDAWVLTTLTAEAIRTVPKPERPQRITAREPGPDYWPGSRAAIEVAA